MQDPGFPSKLRHDVKLRRPRKLQAFLEHPQTVVREAACFAVGLMLKARWGLEDTPFRLDSQFRPVCQSLGSLVCPSHVSISEHIPYRMGGFHLGSGIQMPAGGRGAAAAAPGLSGAGAAPGSAGVGPAAGEIGVRVDADTRRFEQSGATLLSTRIGADWENSGQEAILFSIMEVDGGGVLGVGSLPSSVKCLLSTWKKCKQQGWKMNVHPLLVSLRVTINNDWENDGTVPSFGCTPPLRTQRTFCDHLLSPYGCHNTGPLWCPCPTKPFWLWLL